MPRRARQLRHRKSRRQWAVLELLELRQLLTVDFQFNYVGSVNGVQANIGFNDPTLGPARKEALEAAGEALGSWFDHTATVVLNVEDNFEEDGGFPTFLAEAGSANRPGPQRANGFGNSGVVQAKILSDGASDLNGASAM